jgi:hypothetical protein
MNDKKQILMMMRAEFERWETLLGGLSEAQITARQLAGGWSICDVMAHLRAWQQRSIARLEAAAQDRAPVYPDWPADLDPDLEEDAQRLNAWLYENNRDRPWADVHSEWRAGFLRLMELAESIPEADLLTVGRYDWWRDYALAYVLTASMEHHDEHYRDLPRT